MRDPAGGAPGPPPGPPARSVPPGPEQRRAKPGQGADVCIDTVGLYCPIPIIRTGEAIRRMTSGQVLAVVSDDRVILIDMPAWCRSTGHEYLGFQEEEGQWRLFIRKR